MKKICSLKNCRIVFYSFFTVLMQVDAFAIVLQKLVVFLLLGHIVLKIGCF